MAGDLSTPKKTTKKTTTTPTAAASSGISNSGEKTEVKFRRLTKATKPKAARLGDALLDGHYVEVKKASAGTLNQVRAVKYLPVVAHDPTTGTWWVIPAHEIVRQVADKTRGQHTENPFESATITLSKLGAYKVQQRHLRRKVQEAVAAADKHPAVKQLMATVLADAQKLAAKHKRQAARALKAAGIDA